MKLELRNVCIHYLHVFFFSHIFATYFLLLTFVLSSKPDKKFQYFSCFYLTNGFRYLFQAALPRSCYSLVMCFHCLNILPIASTIQHGRQALGPKWWWSWKNSWSSLNFVLLQLLNSGFWIVCHTEWPYENDETKKFISLFFRPVALTAPAHAESKRRDWRISCRQKNNTHPVTSSEQSRISHSSFVVAFHLAYLPVFSVLRRLAKDLLTIESKKVYSREEKKGTFCV